MEVAHLVLALAGGLIAIGSVITTAVWSVGRVVSTARTTTAVLSAKMDSLGHSLDLLRSAFEKSHDDHERRLRDLEIGGRD